MTRTPKTAPERQRLEQILHGLDTLRLSEVRRALESALDEPASNEDRLTWLWHLLEPQVRQRLERRIREARLPQRKTFDAFDFTFQPELDRDLILELATLRFIDQGKNLLLAGMSDPVT